MCNAMLAIFSANSCSERAPAAQQRHAAAGSFGRDGSRENHPRGGSSCRRFRVNHLSPLPINPIIREDSRNPLCDRPPASLAMGLASAAAHAHYVNGMVGTAAAAAAAAAARGHDHLAAAAAAVPPPPPVSCHHHHTVAPRHNDADDDQNEREPGNIARNICLKKKPRKMTKEK